jgi:hypothetical protein
VRFTADFDFSPVPLRGHVTIAYKAGMSANVTRGCAEHAVSAAKAEHIPSPKRKDKVDAGSR